jgi:hypothetical protein
LILGIFATNKITLAFFSDTKIKRYRIACLDKKPYLDREYFEEWRKRRKYFFPSTRQPTLEQFLG